MVLMNIRPQGASCVRRVVRQKRGYELVGGENESEDAADLLTCTLDRFEAHMRQVYPDWQEFVEWAEDRRAERRVAPAGKPSAEARRRQDGGCGGGDRQDRDQGGGA